MPMAGLPPEMMIAAPATTIPAVPTQGMQPYTTTTPPATAMVVSGGEAYITQPLHQESGEPINLVLRVR